MKNSVKNIINKIVSPSVLKVANTETIELDYSLLNVAFERKERMLEEHEVEVSVRKMLLCKAKINGICVSSVYVPESFTGETKTKKEFHNWLGKTVKYFKPNTNDNKSL